MKPYDFINVGLEADEIDPGKDLFALLFLCFFLIMGVLLVYVNHASEKTVRVKSNSATSGQGIVIEKDKVAYLVLDDDRLYLLQGDKRFSLPEDARLIEKKVRFQKGKTLIVASPGPEIAAPLLLQAVEALNGVGIKVEFRRVLGK